MASRRRATIISADEDSPDSTGAMKCMSEEEVLQSAPKDVHPDDWPIFVLTDAVVVSKDGNTFANLLQAELDGPFTVRGKLEVDEEFRHLCLMRDFKANTVEVRDVKGFSIGTGPTTIWANGKAGWFEIRPAAVYKKTYKKMAEGVELYYFLIDLYESMKSSKRGKGPEKIVGLDQIFTQYAQTFNPPLTVDRATQHCQDHAVFFLSQMRKPGEPISWNHTTFYKWLLKKFPEEHARYSGGSAKQEKGLPAAALAANSILSPPEPPDSGASKITKVHREPTHAVILDFMIELHSSQRLRRQKMSIRLLSQALHEDFEVPSDDMAAKIIKAHAKSLVANMGSEWTTSPIHRELEEILIRLKKPKGELQKNAAKFELLLRNRGPENGASVVSAADSTLVSESICPSYSEEAEDMTHVWPNVNQIKKSDISARTKSKPQQGKPPPVLTESPTPQSPRGKRQAIDTRDDDPQKPGRSSASDDETSIAHKSHQRRRGRSHAGKAAALRLIGTPIVPRQQSPITTDTESSIGPSRKRRRVSFSSSDAEEPGLDFDEDTAFPNETNTNFVPADLMREEIVEATIKLELVEEPLFSSSPPGPDGLWTCHREGCNHQVEGADKPEGRAQVHAHFLDHADQIAARENLVMKESRPHLPINNLLEKLRSLGETARLAEERTIAGRVVPQPIKRQLIV